jgi:hypothetical protein
MIRYEPIPVREAGLYLRDTWRPRIQALATSVLLLCFAAPLLGVTIMCILMAVAAMTHN